MTMVPVFRPSHLGDLAVAESILEAHEIPHFVHNRHFGGLYPGVQIDLFNVCTVMVPHEVVELATELLKVLEPEEAVQVPESEKAVKAQRGKQNNLRLALEFLLTGWFVPHTERRRRGDESDEPADPETREEG